MKYSVYLVSVKIGISPLFTNHNRASRFTHSDFLCFPFYEKDFFSSIVFSFFFSLFCIYPSFRNMATAATSAASKGAMRKFIDSPAGPKTIHFWAPAMKWVKHIITRLYSKITNISLFHRP